MLQTHTKLGDLINQSTVSVIFAKDIVEPNCAYGSTLCLSASLVTYAQNTSTPGSTFGSMFEEFIQESASSVFFEKDIKNMG